MTTATPAPDTARPQGGHGDPDEGTRRPSTQDTATLVKVIGLDLSLTSTGIASSLGWVDRIRPAGAGMQRLRFIRDAILGYVVAPTDLVVVEGPSYGSVGARQHERAGLWWHVMETIDRHDLRWVQVAPAALKRYATGSGNAGKDAVLTAAVRRFPAIEVTGNDEADALWLAAIGAELLGEPMVELPAAQRFVVDKIRAANGH